MKRGGAFGRALRDQRGASAVEFALVAFPLLLLLLGVWDFGLGIWQYNAVAEGARQAARFAIVRGNGATALGVVGPAQEALTQCDAASPGPVTQVACTFGFPILPNKLAITVSWPSGDNRVGEPVVVEATYEYQPFLSNLFKVGTINLKSQSRMLVACCN